MLTCNLAVCECATDDTTAGRAKQAKRCFSCWNRAFQSTAVLLQGCERERMSDLRIGVTARVGKFLQHWSSSFSGNGTAVGREAHVVVWTIVHESDVVREVLRSAT